MQNPAIVRLTLADCYGYDITPDPDAPAVPTGTPPAEWRQYHCATVVRLAPYREEDATDEQRFQHGMWVDNEPCNDPHYPSGETPSTYYFAAMRTDEGFTVEVLPGYLCGVDE